MKFIDAERGEGLWVDLLHSVCRFSGGGNIIRKAIMKSDCGLIVEKLDKAKGIEGDEKRASQKLAHAEIDDAKIEETQRVDQTDEAKVLTGRFVQSKVIRTFAGDLPLCPGSS